MQSTRTNNASSRAVLSLVVCAMCVCGMRTSANTTEAILQNPCGPDSYAPVVEVQTRNGRTQKITRKARVRYESFARYKFVVDAEPEFGSEARKFDEFGQINWCDVKARLDNFAIQLQNEPTAKGYIVVHRSYDDRATVTMNKVMAGFAQNYLVKERGIDSPRIVTINGTAKKNLSVELWVEPNR